MDLLLGLQWGDEGKGKIVDVLTKKYDIIARFQGGPNAGHTLIFDEKKHVLHTIPSGIFHDETENIIGNGVVIDPVILSQELEKLPEIDVDKKIVVSKKAHLILPTHRMLDAASEKSKGKEKIGSTLKGIGPTYMDKTGRNGMRVGDLETHWKKKYNKLRDKHLELLKFYKVAIDFDLEAAERDFFRGIETLQKLTFIDGEAYLNQQIKEGKKILAEGAQGSLLDVDFGTYPFVTSSNTTAAGACTGLGVAPNKIKEVFGIFKAYTTRVGSGPFPTELFDKDGERMAKVGNEFGATTGRPRRCGWLDLVALKYSVQINGRDLKEPRNKPNREDWQNAFPAFKECLEMVHPDVIYTWGKELGNQIKNISENSFSTVNFEGKEIEILHFGDKKIPFKILPHPTSNEFGDKLSPEIAAYKELVKKFLAQ
uniref:Adenylosuccinate synthetase n=1 Tax=Stylophora pistillata TaxID=50429 RepID=A0A2B4RCG9_STYPI